MALTWNIVDNRLVSLADGYTSMPIQSENQLAISPCIHLGEVTGEVVDCPSCQGNVRIKLRQCNVYGKCSVAKPINGIAHCGQCVSYALRLPKSSLSAPQIASSVVTSNYNDSDFGAGLRLLYPNVPTAIDVLKASRDTMSRHGYGVRRINIYAESIYNLSEEEIARITSNLSATGMRELMSAVKSPGGKVMIDRMFGMGMSSCICCGGASGAPCCPGVTLPTTAHLVITLGGTLNGTYLMTRIPAGATYTYQNAVPIGTCDNSELTIECDVTGSKWGLTATPSLATSTTTWTCSPWLVTFTGVDMSMGCGGIAGTTLKLGP